MNSSNRKIAKVTHVTYRSGFYLAETAHPKIFLPRLLTMIARKDADVEVLQAGVVIRFEYLSAGNPTATIVSVFDTGDDANFSAELSSRRAAYLRFSPARGFILTPLTSNTVVKLSEIKGYLAIVEDGAQQPVVKHVFYLDYEGGNVPSTFRSLLSDMGLN